VGYEFQLTAAITINGLSVWDGGIGLPHNVTVGLWTIDGTLLNAAIIPAGDAAPEDNGFRWTPIADMSLQPGIYVVGANGAGVVTAYFANNATNLITTIPGVTYIQDRFVYGVGFNYPGKSDFPNDTGVGGSVHLHLQTPEIIHQPIGISVPVGESANFAVSATNAMPLYYQWKKGWDQLEQRR